MFFVHESVPELPKLDFQKISSMTPQVISTLQRLLQDRVHIQKYVSAPSRIQFADVEKASSKLGFSIELLNTCAKNKLQPEGASYKGFLKNKGKTLRLFANPEVIFTVDFLYSRFGFALATLRSAKDEMENVRKATHQLDAYNETVKSLIEKTRAASQRIYKLHQFQPLISSSLGVNGQIFELNSRTVECIDLLCRVNFASVLVIKTMSSMMNPDKASFLAQLCKKTWLLCQQSKQFWDGVATPETQVFADFFDIATSFFYMMTMFAIIKCNNYENDGLLKKNKDYKTIVWENSALAEEIVKTHKQAIKQKYSSSDSFNIDENKQAITSFFEAFMAQACEDSNRTYGYLKNELASHPKPTALAIVNCFGLTSDFIEDVLKEDN